MVRSVFRPGGIWLLVGLLIVTVIVFAAIRVATDLPNVVTASVPPASDFANRYARFPWLAYAHVAPGVVYLLLAPIQLWRGFRVRHYPWHRRIGRVALVAGLVAGVFGVVFGIFLSFGGALQASASVLFGTWFLVSLVTAYRAIRRGDRRTHRRWMIRAFAMGLAVGTIRIWIGLFEGFGVLDFREAIGVAFWVAFAMHAVAAELWIRWRPWPRESIGRVPAQTG